MVRRWPASNPTSPSPPAEPPRATSIEADAPRAFAVSESVRAGTSATWLAQLRAIGIRCAPVRDYLEVMRDEGVLANGYLQRFAHPEQGEVTTMGCPIRLSDTPARPGRLAPEIGQHTEEVLLELGLGWDEIAALREARAI